MAEVVLRDLRRVFRPEKGAEVAAVDGVSLEVGAGELLVLVGPSGCGKSTLLRMVAGLEGIDSGGVSIGGREVSGLPPKDREVAMVFQNYALYPHMTVHENIAFGLKFRDVPAEEVRRRVAETAALLHLDGLLDRKPKALSGGQRQRVALGRALVRQPRVLLLDEPLSNLDAQMRARMRAEIAQLHARLRPTMIFVTHDQTEAMTLGERVCVMDRGKVVQVGAPLEVYRRPRNMFVAGFIGSPGMNLIEGVVCAGQGGPCHLLAADGMKLPLDGPPAARADGRVVLGVRPEDVEVAAAVAAGEGWAAARVSVCEPMGHETLLYLEVGSNTLVARVSSKESFATGQSVKTRLRAGHASLFDPRTGESVC